MLKKLYPYRFEIFFFSQIATLFGSLAFPLEIFESYISPLLFQANLLAGILLLSKKKKTMWLLLILFVIASISFGSDLIESKKHSAFDFIQMTAYFLFFIIVTYEIIKQVWNAKVVDKTVILGLISGYISIGLVGFFICLSIEMVHPGSFSGLELIGANTETITEELMYYSYITLTTIGYGDILPVTPIAQKAAMLIGLVGQMYLVIITAIVVGKYISQSNNKLIQ